MGFDRMKDRVVIITGGSRGIGHGCCQVFAEEGAKIVLADIDDVNGQKVVQELASMGADARFNHCDVAVEDNIRTVVEETLAAYGRIDVLINNAGVELFKPALETSSADWERTIGVDLRGVFMFSKYVLPTMLEQGKGAIINIASVHAVQTIKNIAAYAAAKGGVTSLTRQMALDYAPKVRINSILPGFIATTLWDRFVAMADDPAQLVADTVALQPMERLGESRDVAQAALFLASDEANWVTGIAMPVDGGLTARLHN